MKLLLTVLLITSGFFICSCDSNQQSGYLATNKAEKKESSEKSLEKVNRYLVNAENKEIEDYLRRHRWNVATTGSGLRYMVYKKGTKDRDLIKKGDVVTLNYKTYLLNGRLLYTSDKLGPKVFEAGHGGVETGLEEAVLLLHKGDKAHLILPSHLAFGLNGDGDRVPKRATLLYNVEIVDVK